MCTLCLSKRSKRCNKKSSWISKLPSVWVEDFTCLQEDLPNLKVLERVLRMNNHFYCHSVQSPSSDQWFPGCLSSSKWPCLSRGAWNRWFLEVPSNLKHSVILWFWCLDVPDLSVTSGSEINSRLLLLLLAPAAPSQQSQWTLWAPSAGFSPVPGSSAFGTLCPSWVQYMMGFAREFQSRLVVQGWQEGSTYKMSTGPRFSSQGNLQLNSFQWFSYWKTLQWPEKAGHSHRGIFLTLKPWFPLSNTSGQRWCWGLHPVPANAFLQMYIPFCFGLAHTSLAFAFWGHQSDLGPGPGPMQLCHLPQWSQYFTCASSDRDSMAELHAQAFTEINSHMQH